MLVRALKALAPVALFLTGGSLMAQTWDGGGGNDNWSTGLNWNLNSAPLNLGTASVVFDGTTRLTPNVDTPWNINSLAFNSTAGSFVIGGSTLTLQGGGIINNASNTQTINNQLELAATQTWQLNSGNLILSGGTYLKTTGFDLTKTGAGTLTLAGSNSNQNTNSTISVNQGTVILAKTSGDAIAGNNAVLTVGDGTGAGTDTVRLAASNQIQDSSSVTVNVNSTGLFDLNGFNERIASLNLNGGAVTTGTGTLAMGNLGGTGISSTASATMAAISGQMLLESYSTTIAVANGAAATDLEISADISGSAGNGRILKTGAGTLVLSGNNTFTDSNATGFNPAVTITGGILQVSQESNLGNAQNDVFLDGGTLRAAGTFNADSQKRIYVQSGGGGIDVTSGNTLTLDDAGQLNGSGNFAKSGAGTLVLQNSQNTFTGNINVSAGTLLMGSSNALSNNNMTLSGGTFATGGFSETLGTLTLTASSVIDLGSGSSIVRFADSSATSWIGTLSVWNWSGTRITGGGTDQLYFGTGLTGLTTAQLSQISFYSDSGTTFLGNGNWATSNNGEVVVIVPEAKTWWTLSLLLAFAGFKERKRLRRLCFLK